MHPPDPSPSPPSPTSRTPPPLPVELIRSILSHLDPVIDHATLSSISRTSKTWHKITFPFLHHTLVLSEWSPSSVDELKDVLKADRRRARAVRHLEMPSWIPSVEEWMDDWKEDNLDELIEVWLEEAGEAGDCPTCGERDCGGWEESQYDEAYAIAMEFAWGTLEEEENADWIMDREEGEKAFFRLIGLLPELESVELTDFHHQVGKVKAKVQVRDAKKAGKGITKAVEELAGAMERATLGDGGAEKEGTFKMGATRKPRQPRPSSFIKHVTLYDCSLQFEKSLKNHWRFSKAKVEALDM